jgi:hypothetical protein
MSTLPPSVPPPFGPLPPPPPPDPAAVAAAAQAAERERERRMLRTQWAMVTATCLPGLAAVIALIFTFVTVQQTQHAIGVSEQGQITDRYNDAVTNLGSDTLDMRLGGIYALQRIMNDSSRDQPTVIRVLSAFIRVHTPASAKTRAIYRPGGPAADIVAALEVLTTRPPGKDGTASVDLHGADIRTTNFAGFQREDASPPSLSGADLHGADLTGSNLQGANLEGADLTDTTIYQVNFTDANLHKVKAERADLRVADLDGADLANAHLAQALLVRASLRDADLSGADLWGTDLRNTSFLHTKLRGTNLSETDLTESRDLTVGQIVSAHPYTTTKLPEQLALNPRVQARIADITKNGPSPPISY